MKKTHLMRSVTFVLFLFGAFAVSPSQYALAQRRSAKPKPKYHPKICGDPQLPCRTNAVFQPYDLPFRIPENVVIDETEKFYAVILKSVATSCESESANKYIAEDERLSAQQMFPHRKVFASRVCEGAGAIYYTNTDPNHNFMAVYAGVTRAEAEKVLQDVKATGKFPDANLRRMRAGFNGT